jgi:alkanesulfonate monooxygenase SsuD/methylene tetrahydromethanopterin reductase-like flavin-dependent oxidoreductase (luciferase family)
MDVGIGLPATIPGVAGRDLVEWAQRADAGPFSSLGIIDRLVYPNYEPLIALAGAAAVTRRVRLMPSVLLAPLRNTGVLAKQVASLDVLSAGRVTLGLAVGGREDDFRAAPASFPDRGRRFEAQLEELKRIWSGQPLADGVGPVGPPPAQPGGPPLLIGGATPVAARRIARWGDGYIAGGGPPEQARQLYRLAEAAWTEAGRRGRPRFVGGAYWALGPRAAERAAAYIRHYYAFLGPMAEGFAASIPSTPESIKAVIGAAAAAGMDELVLWPCVPEPDQVDRLADLLG